MYGRAYTTGQPNRHPPRVSARKIVYPAAVATWPLALALGERRFRRPRCAQALGKFECPLPIEDLLATNQAVRHGLTADRVRDMPALERFAWHWALLNERAVEDLRDAPNARTVRYEDLAADPCGTARDLFAFAGLGWHPQAEAFIRRSTGHRGPGRYHQVLRDTNSVVNRWREDLSRDEVRRIADVVRQTSVWPFYRELGGPVAGWAAPQVTAPPSWAAAAV